MKTVNTRFTIARNIIAALNLFQSNDGSRHALMGTHFECRKDGTTLIATDGRRMATYHLGLSPLMPAETEFVRFTADTTDALKLFRDVKKQWTVELSDDGAEVRFSINKDAAVVTRNIEAKNEKTFPDWRRVIPTTPTKAFYEYAFDPELMLHFVTAAKLLGQGRGVRLVSHAETGGDSAPFSVWLGDPNFYGLLMPMRTYDSKQEPPDWCRLPVAEPAPEPVPGATATLPAPATA